MDALTNFPIYCNEKYKCVNYECVFDGCLDEALNTLECTPETNTVGYTMGLIENEFGIIQCFNPYYNENAKPSQSTCKTEEIK